MRIWILLLAGCTFDPSGLPGHDAGQLDSTDAAILVDGSAWPADASPAIDAPEPILPDAEPPPPDADPPDACVDTPCAGQSDCTAPFTCCHPTLDVCVEGNFHSGQCWPADDWMVCS